MPTSRIRIKRQPILIGAVDGKKDLVCRAVTLFAQLLGESLRVPPHPREIFPHDEPVHDDLHPDVCRFGLDPKIIGRCGAMRRAGQDRKLAVVLKDGSWDLVEVKISLLATKEHKLGEVELGLL